MAAGMFLNLRDNLLPKLPASTEKGTDFDSRVVEAYAQQSQAEAQEITLARALELGHKPTVVSSLAAETANIFTQASELRLLRYHDINCVCVCVTVCSCQI